MRNYLEAIELISQAAHSELNGSDHLAFNSIKTAEAFLRMAKKEIKKRETKRKYQESKKRRGGI